MFLIEEELKKLPRNVKWSWGGSIESENVVEILKQHHVFLFPTFGENYGHVIQEALSAGCPTILSDQTPWRDLEKNNVGYVYGIEEIGNFKIAIEKYLSMNQCEFQEISNNAKKYSSNNINSKVENTGYRDIFMLT